VSGVLDQDDRVIGAAPAELGHIGVVHDRRPAPPGQEHRHRDGLEGVPQGLEVGPLHVQARVGRRSPHLVTPGPRAVRQLDRIVEDAASERGHRPVGLNWIVRSRISSKEANVSGPARKAAISTSCRRRPPA